MWLASISGTSSVLAMENNFWHWNVVSSWVFTHEDVKDNFQNFPSKDITLRDVKAMWYLFRFAKVHSNEPSPTITMREVIATVDLAINASMGTTTSVAINPSQDRLGSLLGPSLLIQIWLGVSRGGPRRLQEALGRPQEPRKVPNSTKNHTRNLWNHDVFRMFTIELLSMVWKRWTSKVVKKISRGRHMH